MDSLADWVGVAVAVFGLFTGTGAGVYYGNVVRRTRLEDRRLLLHQWVPWMHRMFLTDPPTHTGPPSHTPELRAVSTLQGLRVINGLVTLLPYKDRALWSRVIRSFLSDWAARDALMTAQRAAFASDLAVGTNTKLRLGPPAGASDDESALRRTISDLIDRAHDLGMAVPNEAATAAVGNAQVEHVFRMFRSGESYVSEPFVPARFEVGISARTYGPIRSFERHLIRRSNPTFFSRWRDVACSLSLLRVGPHRWDRLVRPPNIRITYQLAPTRCQRQGVV